ncbi:MAG: ATP-binding cassette domain-containing protein [Thioalkalispiraceae bacterium]|jgi:ABC-type iron transport system FetAB ATPase subunit
MQQQELAHKPLLTLKDFSVNHLAPINMTIEAGECITISGPSGSGKSLLLRALADLIPHQGEAYFQGQACSSVVATQWRTQVGLLPAESSWWQEQVGEHFVQRCDEKIKALGFTTDVYNWSVSRCSTGERQRLALLRLLCLQPKVLLLDEPTASLDQENVAAVEALIRDYLQQGGAVIWVSHDPQQVQRVATRHYQIKDRQLVEVSP